MNNFILKGDICYSPNLKEIKTYNNSYLICENGLCKGVYQYVPDQYKSFEILDFSNNLIIPGMVDLHVHAPQYSFRGMCMDLELMDWLNNYTFPEEEKFADLDYAKKAYSIFVEDLRMSATTRASIFATIHRDSTVLLMELLEKSGLVSYVGKVNMDREAPVGLTEESALISAYNTFGWINDVKFRFKNTFPILTPRFIPSCTDILMEELREIQMTYGIPIQSHLSESPGEINFVKELRPENEFYAESYNDYDLFGKNDDINTDVKTIMAHCVWSSEKEIDLIKKNSVFVAHCPSSNMNLSSGIAPIRKYLNRNINVGLGSDVAGGHSLSIFRAVCDTIQVSKLYYRLIDQNYGAIRFCEAFYLATKGGGAFFGNVGSFEEGFEFDAIVLDDSILRHPQDLNLLERLERAFYLSLDEKKIVSKFVKGNKIF